MSFAASKRLENHRLKKFYSALPQEGKRGLKARGVYSHATMNVPDLV